MTAYETFILMFYSLDAIYDEMPNELLGDYLSGVNPFLFEGEGSADPAEFDKFKKAFLNCFIGDNAKIEQTYNFCGKYLSETADMYIYKAFCKISKSEWQEAAKDEGFK